MLLYVLAVQLVQAVALVVLGQVWVQMVVRARVLGWKAGRVVALPVPGQAPLEVPLQAALDAASAGDELMLANGTYTSSGTNVLEIGKSITIRALHSRGAILDGQNARRGVQSVVPHAWYRRTCKLVPWERKRLFAIAQCLSFPALLGTVQERNFRLGI